MAIWSILPLLLCLSLHFMFFYSPTDSQRPIVLRADWLSSESKQNIYGIMIEGIVSNFDDSPFLLDDSKASRRNSEDGFVRCPLRQFAGIDHPYRPDSLGELLVQRILSSLEVGKSSPIWPWTDFAYDT